MGKGGVCVSEKVILVGGWSLHVNNVNYLGVTV